MKKSIIATLLFFLASLLLAFSNHKWQRNEVLHFDVSGYYLYLPATFIYKDLGELKFYPYLDSVYKPANEYYNYGLYPQKDNKKLNKYTLGTAIGELPFFLITHIFTLNFQNKFLADGYSEPYQFSVAMSNILWSTIGLLVLASFLRKKYSDNIVALCVLIIGFGTNLFCYTWLEEGMSHALVFLLFACVLYFTERWYSSFKIKHAVYLGFFLGWVLITRPVDFLIVLLPLMWPIDFSKITSKSRLQLFWNHKKHLLFAISAFLFVSFFQLAYWKFETGHFIHFAYEEEGFNFTKPEILNGLFSFQKGWFVYTPIAFIALLGLFPLWQKEKGLVAPIFFFFALLIYIVFSWHDWRYGWGFGARAMIESYAILSIPLAALIGWLHKKNIFIKSISIVVFSFLVMLNIFQTEQYGFGTIRGENMTKSYYWHVWGKMYPNEEDLEYLSK